MDKIDILNRSQELGSAERKERLKQVAVAARKAGCDINTSKGNSGTLQVRYGGLNLPVLDVSADGSVTVYFRARFKGEARGDLADRLRSLVEGNDDIKIEIGNRKYSGKLDNKIEEIPEGTLAEFVASSVEAIQDNVYDE